jgi:SAM-dependent methyltransferase
VEPGEYERIARLEGEHWWYLGMRAIAAALLREIALPNAQARPARILDAGCGTGGGLAWLAEHGTVTGVDFHPLALRHARRVSARVARASVEALPFRSGLFDLVTSFDVVYHLGVADDRIAFAEMARVLRPGGWLLVRVPSHDWLRGHHDRQVHTRHRYARAELRRKLSAAGLEVRRLTGAGMSLLPAAIARRLLQSGEETESDVQTPPAALNRALVGLLGAEARWVARRDLPTGLSLVALARKP